MPAPRRGYRVSERPCAAHGELGKGPGLWFIGREVVEVEQQGKKRTGYGEQLLELLSARLTELYGKGFSS
ncbi:MAG: hypothetical protein NZ890_19600 [Myxococcota bacterium]|nr:hypothetical protein [Myxococcota bacterium]